MTSLTEPLPSPTEPTPPEERGSVFTFSDSARDWAEWLLVNGGRLLAALLTLFIIAYVAFVGLKMALGIDFGEALAVGLVDLGDWLRAALSGDLGMSSSASKGLRPIPVSSVLPTILMRSFALMVAALLLTMLVGVPLGVFSARKRDSNLSLLTFVLSLLGASLPTFFIAMLLQMAVLAYMRWTGQPAPVPVGGFGWDAHIVLPALVLAARPVAQVARVTHISLVETLDQDYVRTARSKGLREARIWTKHIARNAAIPILTVLATSLRFTLSSLAIVELFFGWPGIGFNLLRAIGSGDANLTVALLLSLGVLFIVINWSVEWAYGRLDPRVKGMVSASRRAGGGWREGLTELVYTVRDALLSLPGLSRLRSQEQTKKDDEFRAAIQKQLTSGQLYGEVDESERRRERRRAWMRGTLGNPPLMLGGIIVLVLLFIIIAGPRIWPHNPYTTVGLVIEGGEFKVPPFPPDAEYPWGADALGRDIMSLILAGASLTVGIALAVMIMRILIGFVLGAIAGWSEGGRLDRLIMAAAEVLSAFPALILAMLLILALGIRNGPWVFVVALGLVGWGETMQFVRSKVISIRPAAYIESAVATGLRTPELIIRHVLPNLATALIALAALEIAAALMLLGELGFIGIFIGGGAFAELDIGAAAYHYSDVPEWGALLANVRTYARAYPWMAIYPAAAFAITILGFNLLGEGLSRLIHAVGAAFGHIFNRRTVLVLIALFFFVDWVGSRSSASALYAGQSQIFNGQAAYEHVVALAGPETQGRRFDMPDGDAAADYIAEKFREYGLQPAGQEQTYFQTRTRDFATLAQIPSLAFSGAGLADENLTYGEDFAVFYKPDLNQGQVEAPIMFVGFGPLEARSSSSFGPPRYRAVREEDFSDYVLLLVNPADAAYVRNEPIKGMLVVAPPEVDLQRYTLFSARDPAITKFGTGRRVGAVTPALWISEEVANRLLAPHNTTVEALRRFEAKLPAEGVAKLPLDAQANIDLQMEIHERVPARHVIGHLPGLDTTMNDQLIMVLAQYDGLGMGPDGTIYPGANDNASSIGLMLEMLRTWQEVDYQPNRTFLFVAYVGEGYETGHSPEEAFDPKTFLKARSGFLSAFALDSLVYLRGLGTGEAQVMEIDAGGNLRLANAFQEAAGRANLKARSARDEIDLNVLYTTRQRTFFDWGGQIAPTIWVSYKGWDRDSGLPSDSIDKIDPEWLTKMGRAISTALMVMGQEEQY
ncbi:MAG: ABC transporter permease subunit [Chloroflexi bacterium]|nr:ABC transporter permease subunit [Chloroflexota bacterium]